MVEKIERQNNIIYTFIAFYLSFISQERYIEGDIRSVAIKE